MTTRAALHPITRVALSMLVVLSLVINTAHAVPEESAGGGFRFAIENREPVGWGGTLRVVLADIPPAEIDKAYDRQSWKVYLNGAAFTVTQVLVGSPLSPEPGKFARFDLVLSRLSLKEIGSASGSMEGAATVIRNVTSNESTNGFVKVRLQFLGKEGIPDRALRGSGGEGVLPAEVNEIRFVVANWWQRAAVIGAGLLWLVGLVWGRKKLFLDRMGAPLYSLSRTQLAFWTTLVLFSFLYIYYHTGTYAGVLNTTALILLGISTATTAASVAEDVRQPSTVPAATESGGFWNDILSDSKGLNIHRLQMAIWTVVFGGILVGRVLDSMTFPDFDNEVFVLTGVSSAAYVWLKRNEA